MRSRLNSGAATTRCPSHSKNGALRISTTGRLIEFERSLIKERQREGITVAKRKGAYKGRKKALSKEAQQTLHERLAAGASKTEVAREFGISRQTLYQYL